MRRGSPEIQAPCQRVLLDYRLQMPGMTGLDLHHRLAASCKPIPTILITAFPDERARERALQAGVICYLTKPFSEDDLLACIRSILGRREVG